MLTKAAEQAKCALHLGIVHIEESGGADADFGYYSSRSRRGYYRYDEMEVSSEDYEVIDVDGSEKYIDSWLDIQNRRMNFGKIPIETGELLPANALDDEEPDEQRLLEATGNAGVSFERAYHRAAFILWPQKKYINVLLQAGLANSVTYFNEQLNLALAQPKSSNWPTDINYIALAIIEEFENLDESKYFYSDLSITSAKMLTLLCQFEKASLVERFIHVIINAYDGSENEALVQAANFLKEPMLVDKLFATLFQKNMSQRPVECINLFKKLTSIYSQNTKTVKDILEKSSQEIINGLNLLNEKNLDLHYWRSKKPAKIDSEAVVTLWTALEELNINQLQDQLTSILIADCHIFNPRSVLVPALAKHRFAITLGSPLQDLLEHAGKYLLTKSEFPPSSPTNWAQEDDVKCSCEDCKDLKNFLKDPKSQVFRFQMVQSGRDHIAGQISRHGLDMTTSTDKSRRPYTLICTKTRKRYQEKCDDYQADVKAMQLLIPIVANLIGSNSSGKRNSSIFNLQNKLKEAVDRQIEPTDHPPKKKHKILLSL